MGSASKVFISYSHDSDEHRTTVLGLCERLRDDGIDAEIDQRVSGTPTQGWPHWMLDELDRSEFVLVVCTETYYRHFHSHEQPDQGTGVEWAGAIITQELYDARSNTTKFVPILFEASDEPFVPEPLRAQTRYCMSSEHAHAALCDFLLAQSGVAPGRVSPPRLPRITAATLVGRDQELVQLHDAWQAALADANPRARIITLAAWGGVGKTALVARWMDELAAQGWKGAERVFEWSFYGQGTRGYPGASADAFVKAALTFFGDATMAGSSASAWDKGARLATLVAQGRNLLVLDGIEPLQYPPGPQTGQLKDPALAALLMGFARKAGQGLCLVTTRETVTDLKRFHATTAPEWKLKHLSDAAGAELLKNRGVQGTLGEREALSHDTHGVALTLELLGSYLGQAHAGDIRKRDQVQFEAADAEVQGGHALKVLAAYEQWLRGGGERGQRQLALLRLMGLFDRPASPGCLGALRQAPTIPGLTEPLVELDNTEWSLVVSDLEQAGLVKISSCEDCSVTGFSGEQATKPSGERGGPERFVAPNEHGIDVVRLLDAHPLLREHLAQQLREEIPEAFRAGHRRLYEHLKVSVPYRPEGLEGLQPLYQAVAHACQAGLHQEALAEVYRDRIQRGQESYSSKQLGAVGAELGASAWFFDEPWKRVVPALSEPDQAWLLNAAVSDLRAVGRLTEALEPMRAGLAMRIKRNAWKNAARAAINLSSLELTLGDLAAALRDAEESVEYANKSGDAFCRMASPATLADALHQTGKRDKALELFREAEVRQFALQPQYPLLYSVQGSAYCDLLLGGAERAAWLGTADAELAKSCRSVAERTQQTLEWMKQHEWVLFIALDHLTLGRAVFYLSILEPSDSDARLAATVELSAAVDMLRASGYNDHLARGLLARAWLLALEGKAEGARADLDEAWEIAERGPMRLHMADVHLYRGRLFRGRAVLDEARRMITELGYGRRNEELEDAERAATELPGN